jgi:hypothetical protein
VADAEAAQHRVPEEGREDIVADPRRSFRRLVFSHVDAPYFISLVILHTYDQKRIASDLKLNQF